MHSCYFCKKTRRGKIIDIHGKGPKRVCRKCEMIRLVPDIKFALNHMPADRRDDLLKYYRENGFIK